MVLPGHLAAGYLVTHALLSTTGYPLSSAETLSLYIIGTLAGDFPDIDLLWFYYKFQIRKSRKVTNHREFITHAPLFWAFVCGLIAAIGILFNSVFIVISALLILGGTMSHLILDSIEGGIRWLWPCTNKRFFALPADEPKLTEDKGRFSYYWRYIWHTYVKRWSFYLEIIITVVAVVMFLNSI